MPCFRVGYDVYIEGEYETEDDAKAELLESLRSSMEKDIEDDSNFRIESFNEEREEWE